MSKTKENARVTMADKIDGVCAIIKPLRYETLTVLRHEAWNDWTDDKPNDAPCGLMWNAIVRVQNERRSNAR